MNEIYIVHHESELEDVKLIGVFDSHELAKKAIAEFSLKAGFSDYVNGFSIDKYKVNKTYWSEGF